VPGAAALRFARDPERFEGQSFGWGDWLVDLTKASSPDSHPSALGGAAPT